MRLRKAIREKMGEWLLLPFMVLVFGIAIWI
jgi:hypothetical protein